MKLLDHLHGNYVFTRRVRRLAGHLAEFIPRDAAVLDVGCGDGSLARLLGEMRPDITTRGIDLLVRPYTHVPVEAFDGRTIPYGDDSFDVVMFVDVLHHTEDPLVLLREARRVARAGVLLKDHAADGWLARPTLRLMDHVGNARYGVSLPYNYWTQRRWRDAFDALGLAPVGWRRRLGLYPWPAGWVFDRDLHFVTLLEKKAPADSTECVRLRHPAARRPANAPDAPALVREAAA